MLSDNLARILAEGVVVALQTQDGHQALNKEAVELDKTAVLGHAQDHCFEVVPQPVLHELDLFPLHQLALGIFGAALCLAGLIGDPLAGSLSLAGAGSASCAR